MVICDSQALAKDVQARAQAYWLRIRAGETLTAREQAEYDLLNLLYIMHTKPK
jgi:hypothetical protein